MGELTASDIRKIEAKAKLTGIDYIKLGDYGIVIRNDGSEDLLYIVNKNKAIAIPNDRYLPEYYGSNKILAVRMAVQNAFGGYKIEIKLFFPFSNNRAMTFIELEYINSWSYSNNKLPFRSFIISREEACDAIVLKLNMSKGVNSAGKDEKTYVISPSAHRKQISNKYVSIVDAGFDADYNRRYVLLQRNMSGRQFRDIYI